MPASRIVVVVGTRYPALSWALIRVLIATGGGHLFFSRVRGKVISDCTYCVFESFEDNAARE